MIDKALVVMFLGVVFALSVVLMFVNREPSPTTCAPERDGMALVYVETNGGVTLTGCVYGTEVQGE